MFERPHAKLDKNNLGNLRVQVVSLPEECDADEHLPIELVYVFKRFPEYRTRVRAFLQTGKSLGIETTLRTPENVLKAVHTISVHSQRNYILSWLPALLRDKHLPVITESDRERAKEQKENIDDALAHIVRDHARFKQFIALDDEHVGSLPEEVQMVAQMNELIYPLQIEYAVHRITADNAHERTEIAQGVIKTLFIIGPIAHILEKFAAGIGKIFAASMDDLLGETAELLALRGSGFTWRELWKRSFILVPVFALASYGAYSVEGLLHSGHEVAGGVVFGLSAVALSLTTAIQSVFMYKKNLVKLISEKKVPVSVQEQGVLRLALRQDFTNPARMGLLLGSAMAPVFGIAGSLLHLMSNGWVLAAIGSTESIVAGLTVIFASKINELQFESTLRRLAYQPKTE